MTIFLFGLILIILITLIILSQKRNFSYLLKKSLRYSLVIVKLPSLGEKKEKSLKEQIAVAQQFLSVFSNFKKPIVLEIAQPQIGQEIGFYIAVPQESVDFLQRQIQAFYPQAKVELSEDYNIFNPEGEAVGVYFLQGESIYLPIKTYQELEADSIAPLINAFSQLNEEGEGLALQIIFRPASSGYKKSIQEVIKKLKEGVPFKKIISGSEWKEFAKQFIQISEIFYPSGEKKEEQPKVIEEHFLRFLEKKISSPLFLVNVRLLASASTKEKAEAILNNLLGGFNQFSAPNYNYFIPKKPKKLNDLIFEFSFRIFNFSQKMLLNTEEIASFWHFPVALELAPQAQWVKTVEAPPPPNLPEEGIVIGESIFRRESKLVRILPNDRRRHVYLIGQTGVGKSVLMTNMVIQDIENGEGVGVIDPHGDMIEAILGMIPDQRIEDVILFDPGDLERPIGLNMLEYDFKRPEQKTFIVNEFISIFDKLYDLKLVGGPMFEYYLRNAVGLLLADTSEVPTLLDVPRIFTNENFRRLKLANCPDPVIVEFWEKEAERVTSGDISLNNIAPYITSKFNTFITNDYMRPIIAQEKSAFNFREIMDNGKIILVNLSKGRLGELNASLLGLILVGKLLIAALSRVDLPENQRKDFYLYIDEFQNFTTPSIATILSEARKYRLNLTMGHQFIAQLDEKIREAVFGNVGTIISFRVGPKDAEFLVKQFEPVFRESDLINLDNFSAVIKLLINNTTTRPFNIRTLPPRPTNFEKARLIKESSKMKYGRPREEIETAIKERMRSFI